MNHATMSYNSHSNAGRTTTLRQGTHLTHRTQRTMRSQRSHYYFKNLQKDEKVECHVEFTISWTDPEGVVVV